MSQYDATHQHHATTATTQGDHESNPGLMNKIADKLGIHSSDKSGDHHKKDDHGKKTATAHTDHKHADPLHHQSAQYDNDPNRIHANDTNRIHDNDPNRVHGKDSKPGIVHKIADKLGIHSSDHKDKKAVETSATAHGQNLDNLHNYQTGLHDNDPNRAHHHHEQNVTTGKVDTGSTHHGQPQSNIDIGGYPVQQTHHHDSKTATETHHHDSNSPGFKEKIKSKLGMNKSSEHHKKDEPGNLFGLPATNPHDQGHNSPNRGFAAGQPPVAVETHASAQHAQHAQHTHDSGSILPMSTPQAEAGSVYSSSMIDNSAVTGDHNRHGHSTGTSRDTGRTYQN